MHSQDSQAGTFPASAEKGLLTRHQHSSTALNSKRELIKEGGMVEA